MQDANAGTRHDNLYAPPTARIADPHTGGAIGMAPFYVVSTAKVAVLSIATFGLYTLYWFWRHWNQHKIALKLDIWPVPRALFSIFFAHALNSEIDHRITRNRLRHAWSPGLWATLYVVAAIVSRLADRLPESVMPLDVALPVIMGCIVAMAIALFHAQQAANIASGDPEALANNRFTWANWIWIILGALWWLAISASLMLPQEPV